MTRIYGSCIQQSYCVTGGINYATLTKIQSNIIGGLPGGSVVKNPPVNAEDAVLIPGPGRSPAGGNGNPFQYSCLGNPMDRGAWQVTVHRVARVKHDLVTEHAHTLLCIK